MLDGRDRWRSVQLAMDDGRLNFRSGIKAGRFNCKAFGCIGIKAYEEREAAIIGSVSRGDHAIGNFFLNHNRDRFNCWVMWKKCGEDWGCNVIG